MIKKKIWIYLLIVLTLIGIIPTFEAKAASLDDILYIDYDYQWWTATLGWSGDHYVKVQMQTIRRRSDNQPVYCIQPHIRMIDNGNVHGITDQSQWPGLSGLTKDQLDRIVLLAYYGYGYGNHTAMEWYYATQLMIWDVAKPGWVYATDGDKPGMEGSSRFDNYYREITSLVDSHASRPSFHGKTFDLKAGETITINDTNNLLEKYYVGSETNNYKAEIKGNSLVVTAKTAYNGTINLGVKANPNPPMLYSGANQLVMPIADPDRHTANINIKSLVETTFEKYYGSNSSGVYKPEKDAEFEIYNSKNVLLSKVRTDENGRFKYEFEIGTYRIHQTKGKEGYKFIKDITFVVDENSKSEVFILKNEILGKGKLEITKEDISTSKPIPNTLFEVHRADDDKLVFSGKTDKDGKIIIELECGKYYFQEKATADESYKLNDEKMYFELKEDGDIVKSTVKNEKVKSTVKLHKLDENRKPMANVIIGLYNSEDKLIGRYATDENGDIEVVLEYGSYYFKEISAPEGYKISDEKISFKVSRDGEIIQKTIVNEKIKSTIKIHKVDEKKKAVAGVVIGLYDLKGNLINKYTTDKDGYIEVVLEYGSYYMQEISAPKEYKISDEKVYFDVTKDGEIIQKTIVNEKIKSTLKIHKVDENKEALAGVVIGVYDSKGKLLNKYTTDKDGYIEVVLEYGSYYLQEISAPEGYKLSDEKVYFDVTKDGEIIQKTIVNEKIKSTIKLHKVDENKEALAGVIIGVFDENDNLLGEYETDENGDIEVVLEYGSYYFKELLAPKGYKLSDEKVYFEVTKDGEVIQKTLVNVLDTGITENYTIEIIGSLLLLIGLGGLVYATKKIKR